MVFGVPQCSVIGLTQFHLNVNDSLHIFYKFKYVSFVEDIISLYSCKKNIGNTLNTSINTICNCLC